MATTIYRMVSIGDYLDRLFSSFSGEGSIPEESPWDRLTGFPPMEVAFNSKTNEGRFRFALAGIPKEDVFLEFRNDHLILGLKERVSDKDDWNIIKSSLKSSAHGEWKYPVSLDRFNGDEAKASWNGGILTVTIPLKEEKKPKKLLIE